ncbi:MAG TPA: hypothetical protein VI078_11215 [bacterium]
MSSQAEFRFASDAPETSAAGRWLKRLLAAAVCLGLFLLPLFGWIAAEPTPYRDPAGVFAFTPPDGWSVDDSGHMGPGLVAKGPASASGAEPLIHLTHEPAGRVPLDVRWQTLLGQMRFDFERLRYLSLEEHEEAKPPYMQGLYSYTSGDKEMVALTRVVLAEGRFFQLTGVATADDFEGLHQTFLAAFDTLRAGGK